MFNPVILTDENTKDMNNIDHYFKLQEIIYKTFGYIESYCIFPMVDDRDKYWLLNNDSVLISENKESLINLDESDYCVNMIYRQRFLDRYIYCTSEYGFTMILVDTHVDGNKFLQILDNNKRIQ